MNPAWRDRLFAIATAVLGVWMAFHIADGNGFLPLLVGVAALAAILVRVAGVELDVLALGALLIGYIVGNRGFAQFMVVPGLPLLPAEGGLAITALCLLWRCARHRSLPWRRDSLNVALLTLIIVGSARFAFDFPRHGFVALRDFAMVYYIGFFFVAQELWRDERRRRFLLRCLIGASALLPFVFALFEIFPEFFLGTLALRGVPLIYFKGDLAPAFFAVGGIFLFFATAEKHRVWARPLAIGMVTWVFTGDNRASMLGTVAALAWIGLSRFRRFTFIQLGVLAFAMLVLIGLAGLTENAWATRKVRSLADRAVSVVDVGGQLSYRYEEGLIKSDNNQFRWVWWRAVVSETFYTNPALGLGFGHDLARGFLQEYNPELAEDFSARSPHNILVTTFGRMGVVGLVIFVWALAIVVARTRRVVRDPDSSPLHLTLWVATWPIAVSSMLGVVLEGPMGAVVFWALLGFANSTYLTATEAAETNSAKATEEAPGSESREPPALAARRLGDAR